MESFIVDEKWTKENYHEEENFAIPEGAIEIGKWAFKKSTSLKSIHLPDNVTEKARYFNEML